MLRTTHPLRTAAVTAIVLAAPGTALLALPATAAPTTAAAVVGAADAAPLEGACTDADGVTVVVDATALGGTLEAGCAPEGGVTGTEALIAAGFTETRDPAAGFVCAVDGQPDPCPTEFTGEYWSYWYAEPGADTWTMYAEGSDTAVTVPGAVEGWRWGDGSAGPEVALPIVAAEAPADPAPTAEDDGPADPAPEPSTETVEDTGAPGTAADDDAAGPAVPLLAGIGLLGVLAVAAVVVARRRATPDDADDVTS
nr:hypothetical protein [uncultured Actinotalea sp.]